MGGHRQRGGDRAEHHRRRKHHRRSTRRRDGSIADGFDPRFTAAVDGGTEAQFVDLSHLQRSAAYVQGDYVASVDHGANDADRTAEGTPLEAAVAVLPGGRSVPATEAAGSYRAG